MSAGIQVPGSDASARDRKSKRVTILDVARRAGVSHQTVSRYLRQNGGLKPLTVAKIDAAVAELDYRPDPIAQSMRTRRSRRLALVLPEIRDYVPTEPLRAATEVAHRSGYAVDVVSLEADERTIRARVLQLLNRDRVEGILSLTPFGGIVAELGRANGVPVVIAGEYDDSMRAIGKLADGGQAAEVIEHLAALGHRRFMHLAGPQEWASARSRRRVYLDTINRLGLESFGVIEGSWFAESGAEAARTFPKEAGISAVFAANDLIALGFIRGLLKRGIGVPNAVSVVGWNDDEWTRYTSPTMSTVTQDRGRHGRWSMAALIADVEGRDRPEPIEAALGQVVLRESTGPAPGSQAV